MTKGNATRLIVMFAIPLIIGNVFQQLYTVTDSIIVGRGVGMGTLASIGAVDWMVWLYFGIIQGFTQGFSILFSQIFGAGDLKKLKRVRGMAQLISLAVSVIMAGIGLLIMPAFFNLLNVPADVAKEARIYSTVIICGLPIFMLYNLYAASLRAVGNSKIPLVAIIVAAVSNIVFDLIAVYVLKLGVLGAALATVLAQLISGIVCIIAVNKNKDIRTDREDFTLCFDDMKNLLKLGAPIALQNVVMSASGIILQSVANSFGSTFIAGEKSAASIYGVIEIAALSFSYAISTYVGQNYGAKRIERVKEGLKASWIISMAIAVIIGALTTTFASNLSGLFLMSENAGELQAALSVGTYYLRIEGLLLPCLYIEYTGRSALQGMGRTLPAVLASAMELVSRITLSIWAAAVGNFKLVIWADLSAWVAGAIIIIIGYIITTRKIFRQEIVQ